MATKEKWADEVIASVKSIRRVTPPDELFHTIMEKIKNDRLSYSISVKKLTKIAAVAAVLIAGNIVVFNSKINTHKDSQEQTELENKLIYNYNIYEQ